MARGASPRACEFIGMLHVSVNTVLSSPPAWRESLHLPTVSSEDWQIIRGLEQEKISAKNDSAHPLWGQSNISEEMEESTANLSFYSFLRDRVLEEANLYFTHGADALMLENIAAPYFVREGQPAVIATVMSCLAKEIKSHFPNKCFGLQILAFSDDLALSIALRHGLQFIRSETGLFGGLRPEGATPNHGNLAKLYAMRNEWQASHPDADHGPEIFVDLRKKHTVFPPGLEIIDKWSENLLFQKVEGAILTGSETGMPVDREELYRLRKTINSLGNSPTWKPRLLVGSGVSLENLALCRSYADGLIIGSSLKDHGYWEYPLNEDRLKRFADAWHNKE